MKKEYFFEFFNVLVSDCQEAASIWSKQLTPYSRRAYVRTVFSFIEGNSYRMKQLWSMSHEEGYIKLDKKDLSRINEYKIDANGKKNVIKFSFKDSVKHSFSIPSKAFRIQSPLDTSGNEWHNFDNALKIRHRLTHPKSVDDMDVSVQDIQVVEDACKYYREATMELMRIISQPSA